MIHNNDVMQKIKEISFSNDRILYLIIPKSIGARNLKSKLVIAHTVSKERDKNAPGMYI
jgi:hypothetical protein